MIIVLKPGTTKEGADLRAMCGALADFVRRMKAATALSEDRFDPRAG